jgi:hypothetical protein
MRTFILKLMVTSKLTEKVTACVEASSVEEAIQLFESDPDKYGWYGFQEWDKEVQDWDTLKEECYDPLNAPVRVTKAT